MNIYEASIQYSLVKLGDTTCLDSSDVVYDYIKSAFDTYPTQESFWVIPVDNRHHPIARIMITLGILNATTVHPREVFKAAILSNASKIIVVHNHPSGDPTPSSHDIKMTRQLNEAGKIIGIELMEHLICGEPHVDPSGKGYYSFHEAGFL